MAHTTAHTAATAAATATGNAEDILKREVLLIDIVEHTDKRDAMSTVKVVDVTACGVLGICGQLSETSKGNGTFFVNLIDNLSVVTDGQIDRLLKIEVKNYEED